MRQIRLSDFDFTGRGLAALREPAELTHYGHVVARVLPADVDPEPGNEAGYVARIAQLEAARRGDERLIGQLRTDLRSALDVKRDRLMRGRTEMTASPAVLQPAETRGPVGRVTPNVVGPPSFKNAEGVDLFQPPRYDTQPVRSVPKPPKADKPKGRGR